MKLKKPSTFMSLLQPLNMEEEKRKFLFDPRYNPQFEYADEIDTEKLEVYGTQLQDELLTIAEKILKKVIKEFGSEENFLKTEGTKLNREQTEKIISQYLRREKVDKITHTLFSSKMVSRTNMHRQTDGSFNLNIRLPIDYRENGLEPVLAHEIGTHLFRSLNEAKQPWNGQKNKLKFADHLPTEEGLAVLNYLIFHPTPYMWMPAMYYYTYFYAQQLSFSELAKKVKPYMSDPDRIWKTCMRAKRGLTDTSLPGGYTKDSVYLKGIIEVSQWLKKNEFSVEKLYIGKIALQDLDRCWEINPAYQPILPSFVGEESYKERLKKVIQFNGL